MVLFEKGIKRPQNFSLFWHDIHSFPSLRHKDVSPFSNLRFAAVYFWISACVMWWRRRARFFLKPEIHSVFISKAHHIYPTAPIYFVLYVSWCINELFQPLNAVVSQLWQLFQPLNAVVTVGFDSCFSICDTVSRTAPAQSYHLVFGGFFLLQDILDPGSFYKLF